MKKLFHWSVLLLFLALFAEAGAALVLFHYGNLSGRNFARFDYSEGRLAVQVFSGKVIQRFIPLRNVGFGITPTPMLVPHPQLGYVANPGVFKLTTEILSTGDSLQHTARILADGSRATSYAPNPREEKIWIFGDSVVWGANNNDEQTFPWLLQSRFPGYEVKNLALGGYGNVQGLLQLRELADEIDADDIVIFAYADYFNVRNVAAPSRIQMYDLDAFDNIFPDDHVMPFGALEDNALQIDFMPMSCNEDDAWCNRPEPESADMVRVTQAIVQEVADARSGSVVFAFLEGPSDDLVIAYAEYHEMRVADLRPRPDWHEYDDFYPYDGHPGPLAQYHYFEKLADFLVDSGLIKDGSAAEGGATTGQISASD